jgi:hypothetical protein
VVTARQSKKRKKMVSKRGKNDRMQQSNAAKQLNMQKKSLSTGAGIEIEVIEDLK